MNTKSEHRFKRNIKLDFINTFITNLNMQSSIWVLYLAYCGMTLAETGILEGIYHATSILFEIPSGAIADLLGRKRSMVLSRICVAVSCFIMLFSRSFGWSALSFMIQALGNNFNSGSEEALIYDSMKYLGQEEGYMGVYGKLNVVIEISQGIATVLGGILAEYSYFACYSACLVIAVLALLPVSFMTEAPFSSSRKEPVGVRELVALHFKTSFKVLKSDARILKIIVYYSVIFAAETLLFFYSQQYYFELGYNKIQISLILLLAGGTSCLGAVMSERMYQRYKEKISFLAAVVIGMALVCYGIGHTMLSVAAFAAAGFCNSVLYPVQSEALNSLIPSEQRATLISVDSMFFSVGMILMFPLAGALADRFGLPAVLSGIGFMVLIFTTCWHWERK